MAVQTRDINLQPGDDVLAAVHQEMRRVLAEVQAGGNAAFFRGEIAVTFTVVVREGLTTVRAVVALAEEEGQR